MKKYIECEKLSKALKIWQNKIAEIYGKNDEYVKCLGSVLLGIDRIPAADVREVVRGKWIEHNYDPEYLSCDFSCSECNLYLEEYYFGEGQWPGKTDHYFCSNCGADMREES